MDNDEIPSPAKDSNFPERWKNHWVKCFSLVGLIVIAILLWHHKKTDAFIFNHRHSNPLILAATTRTQPILIPMPTPLPSLNSQSITLIPATQIHSLPTIKIPNTTAFSAPTHAIEAPYVLQLIGSHHKTALNTFITQHHLEKSATVLKTRYGGKPWYIVIYGHYVSRQQAKKAERALPADLQPFHPWIRALPQKLTAH